MRIFIIVAMEESQHRLGNTLMYQFSDLIFELTVEDSANVRNFLVDLDDDIKVSAREELT